MIRAGLHHGSRRVVARRATASGAFTLVELLVVVTIIGVLVGLLIPTLGEARSLARKVACASNQRQLSTALWAYITANKQRVPYVESPMHNNAFGDPSVADAENDPFDEALWPRSMPHALEEELSGSWDVFACPASEVGWPREPNNAAVSLAMDYRPASANQPNGVVDSEGGYFREAFGFLDGRQYRPLAPKPTDDPMQMAMNAAIRRSVYVRDLVDRASDGSVRGPHGGGINVINRDLEVEFRDEQTTNEDLAPGHQGVKF